MIHKNFLVVSSATFILLTLIVTIGRATIYDKRCHQPTEYIGNFAIEPCSGTYVRTTSLGFPAFYSFPHNAEFGTNPGEFNFTNLLFNIFWIIATSVLVGLFISTKIMKRTSSIQQSDTPPKK